VRARPPVGDLDGSVDHFQAPLLADGNDELGSAFDSRRNRHENGAALAGGHRRDHGVPSGKPIT
jgi:hypothetical protein